VRKIDLSNFHVATSETARDINRRIVLNLIRKHQPVSRADLSRHSGLQRSTVSSIAEQLLGERWIKEGALGQLPRGRKPTFLCLNAERAGIIGVNIRPGWTTVGLAGLEGQFILEDSIRTGDDPKSFLPALGQHLRQIMRAHPQLDYEGIGLALPGRVDSATKALVFAPNLRWTEVDVKTPLQQATGLSVEVENAANACALAESWSGRHGEHARNIVAVTVSEGIGVGMVLNGQLVTGPNGLAGEFGHVVLDEQGPRCGCGNNGCWEVFASNRAAVRYYTEAISKSRNSKSTRWPAFEDILQLARQGDAKAGEALHKMGHYLGIGISMLLSGLAPDVVVVVGEVTEAWDRVEPIIRKVVAVRQSTHVKTKILPTDPLTRPRLRGVIALVLQKHFGAPHVA
jgi:predicted NBD/HSP70 family sugar kinase